MGDYGLELLRKVFAFWVFYTLRVSNALLVMDSPGNQSAAVIFRLDSSAMTKLQGFDPPNERSVFVWADLRRYCI